MISDEDREKVRAATDIVALVGETVVLRQRGNEFWGCCPFHHEKSPSFHVNPQTGLWNCFGCHQGGDVFDYVMKRESLEFPDAIRYLADKAGIELVEERGAQSRGPKRNRLVQALDEAQSFYETMLMRGRGDGPASARSYLSGRGFGSTVCSKWHLGYAPGRGALVSHLREKGFSQEEIMAADLAVDRNGRAQDRFYERAMFPIHDEQGRCIGFGGRVMGDGKPKYLNTRETPVFHKSKHMFAFDYAKESIAAKGFALVVEGYTDVISLHEHGFTNAVATLGTALTEDHVKTLSRFAKTIICMFDGDSAGQGAAEHAIQYLDKTEASLRCVVLPDDLDPAEFLDARGPEALEPFLADAAPLVDFVFDKRLAGVDLSTPGRRVAALDEMTTLLAPLKRSVLLDGYATRLADLLGVSVEETKRMIREKPSAPSTRQVPPAAPPSAPAPVDAGPAPLSSVLSLDDRMQLGVERELLTMMGASPDAWRAHAERISSFSWTDARHQAIAWAILATPDGTSPQDAVKAATEVCPDAPRILSSGELAVTEGLPTRGKVAFLLDDMDLFSSKRRVRAIKSELEGHVEADKVDSLFQEATDLQKHVNQLKSRISDMDSYRKNG
ncbi:MAG: DNA primase [Atopobiaceae bacterium]|nr:DNA primase [Atopobiaceae bacterium]MCI2173281.1 DNA primase [Atopobiaceae bacterium]MCI2207276.1 DNA primase [Atopobiaceae bacterium]